MFLLIGPLMSMHIVIHCPQKMFPCNYGDTVNGKFSGRFELAVVQDKDQSAHHNHMESCFWRPLSSSGKKNLQLHTRFKKIFMSEHYEII